MSRHFLRDLDDINRRLMALFGIAEQMIDSAARALCERRIDLAAEVIAKDPLVDHAEVQIEEECLKVLALHQPVASELRRIVTVVKVVHELERIGDLACNIAERAQSIHEHGYFPIPDQLPAMVQQATSMVRRALDSFVNSDVQLAKQVIDSDDAVDESNRVVIHELRMLMQQDANLIEPALHCFSATRHVERIADLAENISEDVIYLVDGEIVRHKHGHFEVGQPRDNPLHST